MEKGTSSRANPPLWDHQRHPLRALRRSVERLAGGLAPPAPGSLVVDLGCGDKPYEGLFRARGYGYVGADLDAGADIRIVPGERVPLDDGIADGVVSFQVLEHVWDLDWYLGEAHRLLKPDGWLLLSTHGTWLYHAHPTDYRRWTRDGLIKELELRHFAVEQVDALVGPLAWTTQIRLLGLRHALLALPGGAALVPPLALLMNLRMSLEEAVTPGSIREKNASIYVTFSRQNPKDRPQDRR